MEKQKLSCSWIPSLKPERKGLQSKWFTLVELIIVMAILAILWTISFISLHWYTSNARNSARLSDIQDIWKVLELYKVDNWEYPTPTNWKDITYSWSKVWSQWTFGKDTISLLWSKSQISKVPIDPLTWSQYTYSLLNTKKKYQIAWVFEWDIALNNFNTANAAWQYGVTKIFWNYNWKIIKLWKCNSITVLALPSIIAWDLSELSLNKIIQKKELLYTWFTWLPSSYRWTSKFSSNSDKNIFVNPWKIEVYTWTCNNLKQENIQTNFIQNLQQAYSWTAIENNEDIKPITNNPTVYTAQTIIHNFVTPNVKITASNNWWNWKNWWNSNPHIAANWVTITCDWMNPWDTFDVNWKTYTVVDNQMLEDKIWSNDTAFYESACTSLVTSFNYWWNKWVLYNANINPDISSWDTSKVTNMRQMFAWASSFNQPLNNWNVSNVTNMQNMFNRASSFNQPLNNWDTSKVTNMGDVFYHASSFNQPLNNWDVSNVINMWGMFEWSSFNQNINNWNTSKVTSIGQIFYWASSFNQPLNNWDISNVTNMTLMFAWASSFNQPLNNWDVSKVTSMQSMFNWASSFNQPLNNWNVSNVTNMKSMFDWASSFNQSLNNWDTSSATNMSRMFNWASSFNQPLNNWDVSNVTNMQSMFNWASSFNQLLNNWDVSKVTNMYNMFYWASSFNQPLNNWDVSNVTNMYNMFAYWSIFNQPLNNWNTSKVTNMGSMFYMNEKFNQPLNNWDTSKVTNMGGMFLQDKSFNQPLNNWNTSKVTNMGGMFYMNKKFNQPLNNWDTSKVTNMRGMFYNASSFDQDISNWNVSNVTNHSQFDWATSSDWTAAEKPNFP